MLIKFPLDSYNFLIIKLSLLIIFVKSIKQLTIVHDELISYYINICLICKIIIIRNKTKFCTFCGVKISVYNTFLTKKKTVFQ